MIFNLIPPFSLYIYHIIFVRKLQGLFLIYISDIKGYRALPIYISYLKSSQFATSKITQIKRSFLAQKSGKKSGIYRAKNRGYRAKKGANLARYIGVLSDIRISQKSRNSGKLGQIYRARFWGYIAKLLYISRDIRYRKKRVKISNLAAKVKKYLRKKESQNRPI
jgi:hypothetical protein